MIAKCIDHVHVFYEDVAGCDRAVLISDNMKVTSNPTGKHEGLSWVAGGGYNGKHGL